MRFLIFFGNVDLLQEEGLAGHTFDLEVEPACIRQMARRLRGGGGKGSRAVWLIHFHYGNTYCTHWMFYTSPTSGVHAEPGRGGGGGVHWTLTMSALIGLYFPGVFLIASHKWKYMSTLPSLRTLRPREGKHCDPGSASNWVNLNPHLQHPTLLLLLSSCLWAPA